MAQIPRYISKTNATPAFSNARMDPELAAAPYRQAERQTSQMVDLFKQELGAWGQVVERKKAEQAAAEEKNRKVADGLYKAEATAKMTMASSDIRRKALASADGVNNAANFADEEFQKLADEVLLNAPSDNARVDLTKRLIGARAALYNDVADNSTKLNNQVNMDKIEGMLGQYEAFASDNPEAVETVRQQSEDLFTSMKDLGLPETAAANIRQKFNRNLDFHAVSAMAEKDPFAVKDQLDQGAFEGLGAKALRKIESTVNASIKATTKQAKDSLVDVEKRIFSGMPLPQDFETRANIAAKAGLENELKDVVRLAEVSKLVQGKSISDLTATAADLRTMVASGEIDGDPAKIKKLQSFIQGNIKALQSDPFTYAENQGSFKPLTTISDFTALNPEEAQKRQYRALQIQEAYGVPSPALKGAEIDIAVQQLTTLPSVEKVKVLQSLRLLGEDTVAQVTKKLGKKDAGLSQAARISLINPEAAALILEGKDALAQGFKTDKNELREASQTSLKNFAGEDESLQDEFSRAGLAYYAAAKTKGQDISLEDAIKQANNLISVDRLGMFSGKYQTVAPAADLDEDRFMEFVDSELGNSTTWKDFGNGSPTQTAKGKALPANRISPSDYDYVFRKDGKYQVMYEGDVVHTGTGEPVVVDLQKLYKTKNI
jgi:hypothetical protein